MKRIGTIILFISFFSASELNQLYKIPFLIQHYLAHKSQNKRLDFLSYLNLHYSLSHQNDSDQEQDSRLPFKENPVQGFTYLPGKISEIKKPYAPGIDGLSLFQNRLISSFDPRDIFHPPRV